MGLVLGVFLSADADQIYKICVHGDGSAPCPSGTAVAFEYPDFHSQFTVNVDRTLEEKYCTYFNRDGSKMVVAYGISHSVVSTEGHHGTAVWEVTCKGIF